MTSLTAISVAILLAACLVPYIVCQRPYGSPCTESIQCQTNYCRASRCINYGDVSDDVDVNPCATVLCRYPSICVLHEVQCIRAPCPPIASCERRRNRPGC
ncbi:uncharacterized protein [Chelonus insularis]|uniref:uncharacterized protein n=1 Tax=Chelonus insularis TaxID=460826 RepID=UPI00158BDCC8|nr:uncharacterized protein LOC118065651 [Chelonus insularis]